eukprot:scaffold14356_cov38-Prasinocladus_malaysianus.AAC.2
MNLRLLLVSLVIQSRDCEAVRAADDVWVIGPILFCRPGSRRAQRSIRNSAFSGERAYLEAQSRKCCNQIAQCMTHSLLRYSSITYNKSCNLALAEPINTWTLSQRHRLEQSQS